MQLQRQPMAQVEKRWTFANQLRSLHCRTPRRKKADAVKYGKLDVITLPTPSFYDCKEAH